jgi:hypothetical protein
MGLLSLMPVELGLYCEKRKCQMKEHTIFLYVLSIKCAHHREKHSVLGDHQPTGFSKWLVKSDIN